MSPRFDWPLATFAGLFLASLALWRLAPAARRRMRFVWALLAAGLLLRLCETLPGAPRWIAEAGLSIEQLIALHLGAILLFQVLLARVRAPRILSDLAIGAGYLVILFGMLARVGVNLTGIIATSAVATAVIGFGLQDLLGNLASGLALEMEQAIVAGDWIRTERHFGQVRYVRLRHTALDTPDGDTILAPNSALTRSPVTVIGRTAGRAAPGVRQRKLVTFQLSYGHNVAGVAEAVEQALAASPIEGIAAEPKPLCVVLDFHPQHVQYAALVWIIDPGAEYLELSAVRTRIAFALSRLGEPLAAISFALDHRHDAPPETGAEGKERLAALRSIEIFRGFSEPELAALADAMKSESFAPGEIVLRQGEPGGSAYIVRRGHVRILISRQDGMSEQVGGIAPGGFFGEMSLLTGEPRSATAIAADQVDCYRLAKPELDSVFAAHPELAEDVAALLAERQSGLAEAREKLDEAHRRQEALTRGDLLARIRRYFA